jgi:hypothetical protein
MSRTRRMVLGWAGAASLAALIVLVAAPIALADGGWVYSGSFGSAGSGAGQFGSVVAGIVCDGHGTLYVVDRTNNRVEKWSAAGSYLTAWGSVGTGAGQFEYPFGIAADPDGSLWVAEANDSRAQKLTTSGSALNEITSLEPPWGVAVDGAGGVWLAYPAGGAVAKFSNAGMALFQADPSESGLAFSNPEALAVDKAGDAFVGDTSNDRILVFNSAGQYLWDWSTAAAPSAIAVGPDGHVFVGDWSGSVTESNRFGNTIATVAQVTASGPVFGIALDGQGHLWASDSWENKVKEYTWDQPTITTDADGDWHSRTTVVHLSATDTVSGVKSLEYCADGATWRQDDSFALMPAVDHSGDGVYVVQVLATSNDGNTATASFRVKIDTRAPTVTASGPIDEWVRSPQELWFSASDMGSGVGGIEYTIDGGPPLPVGDDGSITVSGDGHHTVTYWATDNCIDIPNASALQTADLYLDSVAPKVATLNNVVVTRGKKASFRFSVNDSLSDHCWVELRIAKKGKVVKLIEVGSRPSETAGQTMSWTCKLASGSYTWRATAYDMAGNAARGALKKLTVK